LGQPSLWSTLKVDGDGSWIIDALCAGSLDIVHDGSYMKKVTPKVCSMALLMRCRVTSQELTCTWVELSDSADNYLSWGTPRCSLLFSTSEGCDIHPGGICISKTTSTPSLRQYGRYQARQHHLWHAQRRSGPI
jgi:hypothetical protein